jgi:hypothetical protein
LSEQSTNTNAKSLATWLYSAGLVQYLPFDLAEIPGDRHLCARDVRRTIERGIINDTFETAITWEGKRLRPP